MEPAEAKGEFKDQLGIFVVDRAGRKRRVFRWPPLSNGAKSDHKPSNRVDTGPPSTPDENTNLVPEQPIRWEALDAEWLACDVKAPHLWEDPEIDEALRLHVEELARRVP